MEKQVLATDIPTTIEPWLSLSDGHAAVDFYKAAFGATETYRMETPDGGLVVNLSVEHAGFWISSDASNQESGTVSADHPIRMILTVADPDKLFAQALNAGASEIFPVGEDFGWRLGRLSDPFGFHWEIGRPLSK